MGKKGRHSGESGSKMSSMSTKLRASVVEYNSQMSVQARSQGGGACSSEASKATSTLTQRPRMFLGKVTFLLNQRRALDAAELLPRSPPPAPTTSPRLQINLSDMLLSLPYCPCPLIGSNSLSSLCLKSVASNASSLAEVFSPLEFGEFLRTLPSSYLQYLNLLLATDDGLDPPSPSSSAFVCSPPSISDALISAMSLSGHGSALSLLVLRGPLVTSSGVRSLLPRLAVPEDAALREDWLSADAELDSFDEQNALRVTGLPNLKDLIVLECPNIEAIAITEYVGSSAGTGICRLSLGAVFANDTLEDIENMLRVVASMPELEFLDLRWNCWSREVDKRLMAKLASKVQQLLL